MPRAQQMALERSGRDPDIGSRSGFSGAVVRTYSLPGPDRFWRTGLFVLYGAGTDDFLDPVIR